MYIDTHTHLTDERYTEGAEKIINALPGDGIEYVINIGYDEQTSRQSAELAARFPNVYAAVAVHPHDSRLVTEQTYKLFTELANNPKVVAVGETGLDYFYDHSPRGVQRRVFVEHLRLANSLNLPVIVHLRDAYADMLDVLRGNKELLGFGGVIHSYSGSAELIRDFLDLGFYLSFSGPVTFKNARGLLDAVRAAPADRILTETDCPYLTPEPNRGKLNYPAYVRFVAEKIAELKGMSIETLNEAVSANAQKLFPRIRR